jgi:methionyl-tRNA synthetase
LRSLLGVSGEPGWDVPWGHGVKPAGFVKEGILFAKQAGTHNV